MPDNSIDIRVQATGQEQVKSAAEQTAAAIDGVSAATKLAGASADAFNSLLKSMVDSGLSASEALRQMAGSASTITPEFVAAAQSMLSASAAAAAIPPPLAAIPPAAVPAAAAITSVGIASNLTGASMLGMAANVAIAVAAFLGFKRAEDEVKNTALTLERLSLATGVSVSQLAALKTSMDAAGVPSQNLGQMVTRFSRAILEAKDPTSAQALAFKGLGIESRDLIGALGELGTHLQGSTRTYQDNALMSEIFGRNVVGLSGFLRGMGGDLQSTVARWKEYGDAVEGSVAPSQELQQAETDLRTEFDKIAIVSLPVLTKALQIAEVGFLSVKTGAQVTRYELEGFSSIAQIVLEATKDGFLAAAYAAGALSLAMTGDIAGASKLGQAAQSTAKLAVAEFSGLKSSTESILSEIGSSSRTAFEKLDADIRRVMEKPRVPGKDNGDENENYSSAQQQSRLRKAQEENLNAREQHQLAVVALTRQGIVEREKLDEIATGNSAAASQRSMAQLLAIAEQEKNIRTAAIDAKIQLYKNDPDSIDKVTALQGQRVAVVDKASQEELAIRAKNTEAAARLDAEYAKAREKFELEAMQMSGKKYAALSGDIFKRMDAEMSADNLAKQGADEVALHRMKGERDVSVAAAKAKGEGPAQQIAIMKAYDERIKAVIDDLTKLRIANLNQDAPDFAVKAQKITNEGNVKKSEVDEHEVRNTVNINQQAAAQIQKAWEQVTTKLNSDFDHAFRSIIDGTEKASKAFSQMGAHMVADLATHVANMILEWAEFEIETTVLHAAGVQTKQALDMTQRISSAKTAAANVYASVSAIPYVGWILAPPAAAAAFTGALAFEQGGIVPNQETMALLHPREMVLPANISESVQRMASSDHGSNDSSGGETHYHYHAFEGQTDQSMRRDFKKLQRHAQKQQRLARA